MDLFTPLNHPNLFRNVKQILSLKADYFPLIPSLNLQITMQKAMEKIIGLRVNINIAVFPAKMQTSRHADY